MKQSRELKAEYKRLKRLVKQEPSLFARLADVEQALGKTKTALRRLENGLGDYPEHAAARSIYADCLSQTGDHESSLKQWEEVIYAEPMNQKARAGYIRELAYLERSDSMSDALGELYLIDPFDEEIEERHKDAVLQSIRDRHPSIRAWNPQWHPGDFTGIGAVARAAVYSNDLMPRREALPDGFEPALDEKAMQALLEKMPAGEVGEDLEESIGQMVEEPVEDLPTLDEGDIASALDTMGLENELDVEAVSPDQTEEAEERALSALLADEESSPSIPEEATKDVEEKEEAVEEEELEPEPEPEPEPVQPDNPLLTALKAANVDTEGMVDIESIVNQLDNVEVPIVEPPDFELDMEEYTEEEEVPEEPIPDEKPETRKEEKEEDVEITQDDLDALMIESEAEEAPAEDSAETPAVEESGEPMSGPMTQDQLDALFSAPAPTEPSAIEEPAVSEQDLEESSPLEDSAEPEMRVESVEETGELSSEPAEETDESSSKPMEVEISEEPTAAEGSDEIVTAASDIPEPDDNIPDVSMTVEEEPSTDTEIVPDETLEADGQMEDDITEVAEESEESPDEPSSEERSGSTGFDIDRWFAARREKRIREQSEMDPDLDDEAFDAEPVEEPVAEVVDEVIAEVEPELEQPVDDVEESPADEFEVMEEAVAEGDAPAIEDEVEETEPVQQLEAEPEVTSASNASPRTLPAMTIPGGSPRPKPLKPSSREDEIAPDEIRGPVTKTFAKLYMQQGKMEHAAEIVRRLLLESPTDEEILDLKAEIDEHLA